MTTSGQAVFTTVGDFDATTPEEDVREVDEQESAPAPDSAERAKKRGAHCEKLRQEMVDAGCDPAKVDELVAKKQVVGSRQRITPVWATVNSPEAVAFWGDRSDEQVEADMTKLLRRDGGQEGPEALYGRLIHAELVKDGILDPDDERDNNYTAIDAARAINAHVGQRIYSARVYVTMAINELRRRRAVAAGLDPKSVKYLNVTAAPASSAEGS